MHRTARTTLVVLLTLTALLIPAAGVAADVGLTLTADTATLGPTGPAWCCAAPTRVGRSPPAVPTGA
jgi:hypothetical protein